MQLIEHELEVTVRVHEVRSEYARQMQEYVLFSALRFLNNHRTSELVRKTDNVRSNGL